MAWAIKCLEFWKVSSKDPIRVLEKVLEECMSGLIPDGQDRWTKGIATVVLADTLVNNIYFIYQLFSIFHIYFKKQFTPVLLHVT